MDVEKKMDVVDVKVVDDPTLCIPGVHKIGEWLFFYPFLVCFTKS